jgi:uncharacterized protein YhaN
MRIERLEIDGFGRFHDASWSFDEGLTVLHGANEAGKTTLLNALRAFLFGFEATRDGRTWYPALAGGRRGGRLALRTRDGERWIVERHGERGGAGALAVRAPSGNQGGQETLDRLLHGADRDLFTNIFAFGLGELQTFASLSADGVRGRIYGAGVGLGGTSAVDLERRLRQQLDGTFLPRGRERPLNQMLARIEELRREIADLGRQPEEHADANREREELRMRAVELRASVRAERERAARLSRLLGARVPAAEVALLAAELEAGDSMLDEFPADAVAVVDRHLAGVEEARRARERLDEEIATVRLERGRLAPDTALLAAADHVIAVRDARAARAGSEDRRRELESALARHAHAVDEQVARAGVLAEDALLGLDDSIAVIERTRELERTISSARGIAEEADRRVRLLAEELAARERDAAPGEAGGDGTHDRLAALEDLDALRMRRAVAAARSDRLPPWASPVALAVLAVLVAGAAVAIGQVGLAAPALVLAGVAGWLWVRGARKGDELAAIDAERRDLLARAGLPVDADDLAVRRLETELATDRARATLAADHRASLEARRRELRSAELELARALEAVDEAGSAWAAWLRHASLPDDLSPEVARQVLGAAGAARRAAVERDDHRQRLETLAAEDAAYAERVEDLARRLDASSHPPPDAAARDAFVVGVVHRLDAAREAERRARDLDATIERLDQRRETAVRALAEREEAFARHVAELGCPDADAVRARSQEAAARRGIHARLRELRAELAGIAGGAEAVDSLVADALSADAAEVEAALADAREQVERLEAEERDVLNRIGALDARIAQLERAEELGIRRQELAGFEGRAAAMAREWAVGAIALRLLEETRSRYERERQPDVVRAATTYFERITDGRYARIVAPPGEPGVRVETEGGEARGTEELSRGTAEQLYLALRFGLIEEFARSAEPLPVVMDDILVNFDAERAARAATAIRDLADRHQVLYFTCHRPIATLLDPDGDRTLTLD